MKLLVFQMNGLDILKLIRFVFNYIVTDKNLFRPYYYFTLIVTFIMHYFTIHYYNIGKYNFLYLFIIFKILNRLNYVCSSTNFEIIIISNKSFTCVLIKYDVLSEYNEYYTNE